MRPALISEHVGALLAALKRDERLLAGHPADPRSFHFQVQIPRTLMPANMCCFQVRECNAPEMNFNLISTDMKRVMSASFSPTPAVIGGLAQHALSFWWWFWG
jgi:hypothetical protein